MQYRTLTDIKYDGVQFKADEILDLDPVAASGLLEVGAIGPMHKPFEKRLNLIPLLGEKNA